MIVCHCLHLTMKFVCVSDVSVVRMPRNIINEMQRFRRNNRLTENNAKCCWTGQKQGNQLLQNMVSNTTQHLPPPPSHTLSAYTVLWHWERGMGGERWTREKNRGAIVHKAGSKIWIWLTVSPVYKLYYTTGKMTFIFGVFIVN